MDAPYILHMFTPGRHMSPFDINMAADAGWQHVVPYADVGAAEIAAMTQDTIFSRGPKRVARTGIFIGGRDALLAADMLEAARKAMVPPFVVSVMADPSGAYTTAAAMVACCAAALPQGLQGRRALVLGGSGPVGRIVCVLLAQAGAVSVLGARGAQRARDAAAETAARFGVAIEGAEIGGAAERHAQLAQADAVFACAAAGVQVLSAADLAHASQVHVFGDLNAVPPAGIAGLDPMANGKPLAGSAGVGFGALAIGNVKYQTQQRLLVRMRETERPVQLGFAEAYACAREVVAEKSR